MITNVVVRWPGSSHNSRIFTEYGLNDSFDSRKAQGLFIDDAGHACLPYLMTPIAHENEVHYN